MTHTSARDRRDFPPLTRIYVLFWATIALGNLVGHCEAAPNIENQAAVDHSTGE